MMKRKDIVRLGQSFSILVLAGAFLWGSPALAKKKVIGISNLWVGNEWNYQASKVAEDKLKEMGYDVLVTNAEGKTSQQKNDVENFISKKVDGIIIKGGEGGAFIDVSEKAFNANIPVIGVLMFLPGAVCSVCEDSWEGNALLGEWLVNQMHGSGKYIILTAAGWHTLEIRQRMVEEVLRWYPKIVRVAPPYECATADPVNNASNIVKATLRANPDLKAVNCTWSLPAVGAIKAIMELKKQDQVGVISTDLDRPLLTSMGLKNAPETAAMGIIPRDIGIEIAKLMNEALQYGTVQEARAKMQTLVTIPPKMTSNCEPKKSFRMKQIYTMDEAWEAFHPNTKKPW